MIESATFHVIPTELVAGSFDCRSVFCPSFLSSIQNKESQFVTMMIQQHTLPCCLAPCPPFAIASGSTSPSGAHTSPLANKMLLSTAGGGLALGVLFT